MFPHPETGEITNGIAKVRYTHDAMIDMMIAEPSVSQNKLADVFGYSVGWVSLMINSDAFQSRLAERKKELVDPVLIASIQDRLKAIADLSLGRLMKRLESPLDSQTSDDFLLKSAKLATDALGYGARVPTQTTNVAVVVQVPAKIVNAAEWAAAHAPANTVLEALR